LLARPRKSFPYYTPSSGGGEKTAADGDGLLGWAGVSRGDQMNLGSYRASLAATPAAEEEMLAAGDRLPGGPVRRRSRRRHVEGARSDARILAL